MKSIRIPAMILAIAVMFIAITGCDAKLPAMSTTSLVPAAASSADDFAAMKIRAEKAEGEVAAANLRASNAELQVDLLKKVNASAELHVATLLQEKADLTTQLVSATGWTPSAKHTTVFVGFSSACILIGFFLGYRVHRAMSTRESFANFIAMAQQATNALGACTVKPSGAAKPISVPVSVPATM